MNLKPNVVGLIDLNKVLYDNHNLTIKQLKETLNQLNLDCFGVRKHNINLLVLTNKINKGDK